MNRSTWKSAKSLTLGALLLAAAVMLQASAMYMAVVGVSVSGLSTLPVALAAYYNRISGLLAYLGAGMLLIFLNPPQGIIFMFSSGLLGLSLGILLRCRRELVTVVIVPSLLLCGGVFAAGGLLGVPVFPWLSGLGKVLMFPLMALCCLLYTAVWIPVLAAIIARLRSVLRDEETGDFY